jgi:putative ABC transport system permease protein
MLFITFIMKNLMRRPLRSGLTMVAVAIAIGALVSLVGVADGFERSFLKLYDTEEVDLLVVQRGVIQQISSSLDEELTQKIENIPGVKQVLPGLVQLISEEIDGDRRPLTLQGWLPQTKVFDHLTITSGRNLTKKDTKHIIIGTTLAENIHRSVGGTLNIMDKPFKIVGIYESDHVYEKGALVMPLKELQDLIDMEGRVTGLSVFLEKKPDQAAVEHYRKEIEKLEPGYLRVDTPEDFVKKMLEIRMAKGMAWVTSAIALLIGLFGMMNTMVMSVHERTREIGILRAVGWRPWRVVQMILLESVVLSILGAIAGVIGAVVLVQVLAGLPTVNSFVEGKVSVVLILYGQLLAVSVGLVGGALPALRAARMLPTAALRYE